MESVCKNCDLNLKQSDCSDAEYAECEIKRWLQKYLRWFDTDELTDMLESEYNKYLENNGYYDPKYMKDFLIDMARECMEKSKNY